MKSRSAAYGAGAALRNDERESFGRNSRTFFRRALQDTAPFRWLKGHRDRMVLQRWNDRGRQEPPPHAFKRRLVIVAGIKSGANLFVETGTFYGDMVDAVRDRFSRVVSIELDRRLHELAQHRFRDQPHIQLLCGNSDILLPTLLNDISEPGVFWLDAHYSGPHTARGPRETPILTELDCLLNHIVKRHVILIDDARCFDGSHDYPSATGIQNLIDQHSRHYGWVIEDDVIQIWPKGA